MKPCHIFAAMNGFSTHGTHEPKTIQLVHQQLHIAHIATSASLQSVTTAKSGLPGFKEEWSILHLLKVLENAKQ